MIKKLLKIGKKGQIELGIEVLMAAVLAFILVGAFGQVLVPIYINMISPAAGNLPNSGTSLLMIGIGFIFFFSIPIFIIIQGIKRMFQPQQPQF